MCDNLKIPLVGLFAGWLPFNVKYDSGKLTSQQANQPTSKKCALDLFSKSYRNFI